MIRLRMKKVMSIVIVLFFSWLPVYAVSFQEPAVFVYFGRLWNNIRNNYLLYDTEKRFEYQADEIDAFLSRIASLLQDPIFIEEGGLEILKEGGIIEAACIRADGKVRIIGNIQILSNITGKGYVVDDKDILRFVCTDTVYRTEAILNESYIRNSLQAYTGNFYIYDSSTEGLFALTSGGNDTVAGIDFSGFLNKGPLFLKVNKIFAARPLRSGATGVYIVTVGPFIAGYTFFRTAALIVLLISAIILFVRAVLYSMKTKSRKGEGARAMDEKSDIIREIDMEISDIIEEESSEEPKKAPEKKPTKEDVEDIESRLESDGIIIKK